MIPQDEKEISREARIPMQEDLDERRDDEEEEDLLLGGHSKELPSLPSEANSELRPQASARRKGVATKRPGPNRIVVGVGLFVLFALAYILSYLFTSATRYSHSLQASVILMISDGFGPASETFARTYLQHLHQSGQLASVDGGRWDFSGYKGKDGVDNGGFGSLPLDSILVGQSRTRSSNSLVTDSAAGATAFSCAMKSYNGAISVRPEDKMPCGTVLEAAKHKGYLTGVVATSRITHATPACFYAHVVDRDMESEIANFLVGEGPLNKQVDLALGGGLCFFQANSTSTGCRNDDRDMLKVAEKNGYGVVTDVNEVRDANRELRLPLIGLFNRDHMNYEVDRVRMSDETKEPSLKEMAIKAASTLKRNAKKGFFLMVEGSRIDMAGHSNDPVGHLYDILAYQETLAAVKEFVDQNNKDGHPTVMISVSDHETGGLALALQLDPNHYPEYAWYPDALINATHSTIYTGQYLESQSLDKGLVEDVLRTHLGIIDPSEHEINDLLRTKDAYHFDRILSTMISRRAQLGWSTHGHSGVDVNLGVYGYKASELTGNRENTEIGDFIARVLELDLETVTADLNRNWKSWHTTESKKHRNGLIGVQHYHHDY